MCVQKFDATEQNAVATQCADDRRYSTQSGLLPLLCSNELTQLSLHSVPKVSRHTVLGQYQLLVCVCYTNYFLSLFVFVSYIHCVPKKRKPPNFWQ